MQFIFNWLGYVKIPTAVVQLSIAQEDTWKFLMSGSVIPKNIEYLSIRLKAQQTITEFLRSGKLISG